jgi:hypothetical protein
MNGTTQYSVISALRWGLIAAATIYPVYGQTLINLSTQGRNVDFSSAPSTRPVKTGTALPATCAAGELFFNTSAPAGQNLYGCSAANAWSLQGAASPRTDPGSTATALTSGTLSSISSSCSPGAIYFATDQPAGQQIYTCSAANTWTQLVSLGGSGALAYTNGALDIVTGVVPLLASANTFTGLNSFAVFQVAGTSTNPGCASASDIGKIWINTTSASSTAYEVCLAVSGTVQWVTK